MDMSTPLLPEVVPEIDANVVFLRGGGKRSGPTLSLMQLLWNSKRSSLRLLCLGSVGLCNKRLGATICANLLCTATSHITSSTIPNCFSLQTQYCPCHPGWYLQFLERCVTNTLGLVCLQNTENEANLLLPLGIQKLKGFQLQGASPPWPPDQGLCPCTLLGALPPDPRYRLALAVCPPHIFWPGNARNGLHTCNTLQLSAV